MDILTVTGRAMANAAYRILGQLLVMDGVSVGNLSRLAGYMAETRGAQSLFGNPTCGWCGV